MMACKQENNENSIIVKASNLKETGTLSFPAKSSSTGIVRRGSDDESERKLKSEKRLKNFKKKLNKLKDHIESCDRMVTIQYEVIKENELKLEALQAEMGSSLTQDQKNEMRKLIRNSKLAQSIIQFKTHLKSQLEREYEKLDKRLIVI
jgi:predicted RNase H-like nuclease (RuvC/YqgF family)